MSTLKKATGLTPEGMERQIQVSRTIFRVFLVVLFLLWIYVIAVSIQQGHPTIWILLAILMTPVLIHLNKVLRVAREELDKKLQTG